MNRDLYGAPGDQASIGNIDAMIAKFYAAFDNRERRRPDRALLRRSFARGAMICRVADGVREFLDVAAFIEPRVRLLEGGSISDFHEWEVEAETEAFRNIAARSSRYKKCGTTKGIQFSGSGRKLFHFCREGAGWLITSLLWEDDETS